MPSGTLTFNPTTYYHTDTTWTYIGYSVGVEKLPFSNSMGVHGLMGNPAYGFDYVMGSASLGVSVNSYLFVGSSLEMKWFGNCMSAGSMREIIVSSYMKT